MKKVKLRFICQVRDIIYSCNQKFLNRVINITNKILGQEVVFQCRDEGPLRVNVKWSRGNGAEGLPFPPGTRDFNGRLEIPDIKVCVYILTSLGSGV